MLGFGLVGRPVGDRAIAGLGGADSLREWIDRCDVEVEADEDREEKDMLPFENNELSEFLEARESDCWRVTLSIEAFLVCEGDRLGMAGAWVAAAAGGAGTGLRGAMKYVDKWFASGDPLRSPGATSGLVGGVESRVLSVSESSSDFLDIETEGRP
jgi:hypothetical protein